MPRLLFVVLVLFAAVPRPARAGENDGRIQSCIAAVRSPKEPLAYRRAACTKLGELGPEARAAVPALVGVLHDGPVAYWAACALRSIGPDAATAVRKEIEGNKKAHPRARLMARLVLAKEPPFAELLRSFRDPQPETRFWAIDTLARLGKADPRLAPKVCTQLEGVGHDDKDPAIRAAAVFVVAELDEDAGRAVRLLTRVLTDKQARPAARARAAEALGKFGPKARFAEPALVSALREPDPLLARRAAASLGRVGAGDGEALPALYRLAVDAAGMGYADLYETARNSSESILRRVRDADRQRQMRELARRTENDMRKRRERFARQQQERVERELAALQRQQIEAKSRSDARIFGGEMCYGRQAHLDDAAYCAGLAAMYQGSAAHWSSLGDTDAARSCAAAAEQYLRHADHHRDAARALAD